MKVGYVLRWFPARSETFVAREIEALRALGTDVEVASLGTRSDTAGALTVGAPVFHAPRGTARLRHLVRLRPSDRRVLSWQRPKDVARLPWLRRLASERGWDRLHVHFAGEALEVAVTAATGLPVSVTVHASDLFRPRPSLPTLLQHSRVVTICEHHRAWIHRHYRVPTAVVRCGVDPSAFPVPAVVDGVGPLRLISVARDVPKKGLDQLVRCLPDDSTLRLVAPSPRLAGPRVRVGALPAAEVPRALASAQIFVLPCRVAPDGDRDGVPVALMEAMAAGLPVVTTAVSGIPELVDDSVGWLVPPDDDEALREALEAARDPEQRRRRGAAARARILDGWTAAASARQLNEFLASVAC